MKLNKRNARLVILALSAMVLSGCNFQELGSQVGAGVDRTISGAKEGASAVTAKFTGGSEVIDRQEVNLQTIANRSSRVSVVRVKNAITTTVNGKGVFASGKSSLSAVAFGEVSRIGVVLAENTSARIMVEGYTDILGNPVRNQKLSKMRASAIAAILIENGIKPQSIEVVGHGAKNPKFKTHAQNRRVEITITPNILGAAFSSFGG